MHTQVIMDKHGRKLLVRKRAPSEERPSDGTSAPTN